MHGISVLKAVVICLMLQVEARPHQVTGKIFSIVTHRTRTGSVLKLEVNFPQEVVQLSKEVCI